MVGFRVSLKPTCLLGFGSAPGKPLGFQRWRSRKSLGFQGGEAPGSHLAFRGGALGFLWGISWSPGTHSLPFLALLTVAVSMRIFLIPRNPLASFFLPFDCSGFLLIFFFSSGTIISYFRFLSSLFVRIETFDPFSGLFLIGSVSHLLFSSPRNPLASKKALLP